MHRHVATGLLLAGFFLAISPAAAGTIYVSPSGSNTATCGTAAAPCQTLQKGIDRVDPGGTVLLTEPGNYSAATINKALSIRGAQGGGIYSPPSTPCLTINGGGSDTVVLDNLVCDMDGAARDGIVFNSGHKIRGNLLTVRGTTGPTCGLLVKPSSGTDEVTINNSTFSENGTTGSGDGGGICFQPSGTAHLLGVIRNSIFQNGRHGVVANPTGSGTAAFLIDGSDLSNNAGGAFFNGNSTACLRNSTITGNTFIGLGGSGALLNGGGNTVWNNAANGVFTGNCP